MSFSRSVTHCPGGLPQNRQSTGQRNHGGRKASASRRPGGLAGIGMDTVSERADSRAVVDETLLVDPFLRPDAPPQAVRPGQVLRGGPVAHPGRHAGGDAGRSPLGAPQDPPGLCGTVPDFAGLRPGAWADGRNFFSAGGAEETFRTARRDVHQVGAVRGVVSITFSEGICGKSQFRASRKIRFSTNDELGTSRLNSRSVWILQSLWSGASSSRSSRRSWAP